MEKTTMSLIVDDTWELQPLPLGRTPIHCKTKPNGSLDQCKARLVG